MKKQVLNYVMVLVLGLSTSLSFADPMIPSTGIATFEFNDVEAGELLTIQSFDNEILYSEYIDKSGYYRKSYDLSLLQNGEYLIVLEKTELLESRSFTIKNGKVISVSDKTIVYRPTAHLIKNKLYVSQYTSMESKLEIELYFKGNLIHNATAQGKGAIGKIFQLDLTEKGDYVVVMKSNNKVFRKNLEI